MDAAPSSAAEVGTSGRIVCTDGVVLGDARAGAWDVWTVGGRQCVYDCTVAMLQCCTVKRGYAVTRLPRENGGCPRVTTHKIEIC